MLRAFTCYLNNWHIVKIIMQYHTQLKLASENTLAPPDLAAWTLSVMGISSTSGRILVGVFASILASSRISLLAWLKAINSMYVLVVYVERFDTKIG